MKLALAFWILVLSTDAHGYALSGAFIAWAIIEELKAIRRAIETKTTITITRGRQ